MGTGIRLPKQASASDCLESFMDYSLNNQATKGNIQEMVLNIGLINENVIMRLGIEMIIVQHFESSFSEASDPVEFTLLHAGKVLDVIILGINDDSDNCMQMISGIFEQFQDVPLIVFDESDERTFRAAYLEMGVHGYLIKQTLSEELPACLREIIAGRRFLASALFQALMASFQKPSVVSTSRSRLTRREVQIADLLCKGMRTNLIADSLGRKPSTISTIKYKIMRKMNVQSVMELSQVLERTYY